MSFQLYKSGVYNGNCGTKLDHGVLAVGYGTIDGKNYYKVKNSWGSRWGSQGYIYIARNGDGKGKCGILMEPSIPVLWYSDMYLNQYLYVWVINVWYYQYKAD